VNELTFSRKIIRQADGVFFRVTLRNLPVWAGDNAGTFERAGDVQKHVAKIEYMEGLVTGGEIVPACSFASADWKSVTPGQVPTLKVTFAEGSGAREWAGPTRGGSMSMQ